MFTMEAVTYASHTTFLNVSSSLKPNQNAVVPSIGLIFERSRKGG